MKILTDQMTVQWLRQRGIQVGQQGSLSFASERSSTRISLYPPNTREAVTSWALNMVAILGSGDDRSDEWLLWLVDFDIWDANIEEIGWTLIGAVNEMRSELTLDSSAFLFSQRELHLLKAALLVPILFMWDAFLVRGDGKVVVNLDHDDQSSISTISNALVRDIHENQLSRWVRQTEIGEKTGKPGDIHDKYKSREE